jgi:Peptidase inhibitor I78 family
MRRIFALAPALLAACSNLPAEPPIHGVTPGHKCETDGTAQFIGAPGTSETGARIMRVSHAAVLRWARPGTMLTMDYREDRVTVHLDGASKVTEIRCG